VSPARMPASRLVLVHADEAEPSYDQNEAALLERARNGDQAAFAVLHKRHAPAVGRFLRDLLGDPESAQEALQETLVRAYLHLGALRHGERLLAWLFGIGRRVCLESLRAARRRPDPLGDEGDMQADPAPSPEMLLVSGEAHAQLDAALAALSADRRTVLVLRSDHELSCAEIASVMGWSVSKVKVELFRARLKLRELLAPLRDSP